MNDWPFPEPLDMPPLLVEGYEPRWDVTTWAIAGAFYLLALGLVYLLVSGWLERRRVL